MIMTMLRMQKGAKEKKIQRQQQDDDLPDPDDIELFADFDEGAESASFTPSTRRSLGRETHRSPSPQTSS
jgi:hypothetical protein